MKIRIVGIILAFAVVGIIPACSRERSTDKIKSEDLTFPKSPTSESRNEGNYYPSGITGESTFQKSQTSTIPKTNEPEIGKEYYPPGTTGGPMVYVPEGEFMMGCNEKDCYDWDKPYHQVFLNAYFIDKYQVTVEDYKKCVNAGICIEPPHGNPEAESFGPTYWVGALRKNSQKCPIDWIPWNTAKSYCEWVGKRLPTDAEWEKAARGTDGRRYPWGNNDDRKTFCEYAVALTYQIQEFEDYIKDQINGRNQNFCEDKTACSLFVCEPCPVGSRPKGKSPYGAMDMAGNVKEWVNDWFDKDYYKNSPYKNPTGPTFGEFRVTRNTNPCNPGWNMRAFVRGPGRTNADMGFRCARDAELKK